MSQEFSRGHGTRKLGRTEQIKPRKYKPSTARRVYIPKDNRDTRGLTIINDSTSSPFN